MKPLAGLRVIDLTQAASGPIGTSYLAALGADVIKVERIGVGDLARRTPPYASEAGVVPAPVRGDEIATTVLKRNRNKRSIAVDLTQPEGVEILRRLVAASDVFVENFKPGATAKLGIAYDDLRAVNPRLIYCSITAFGSSGPYRDWAGYDTTLQAVSGVMATTGFPGELPAKTGVLIGDTSAPLFAATAILAALRARDLTGEGQAIEVAMFDCLISMVWDEPIEYYVERGVPTRSGNRFLRMAPWNLYPAKDGHVVICVGRHENWVRLAELMGRPELAGDPRFASMESRLANVEALDAAVAAWTSQHDRTEIVERAQAAGIAAAQLNELADLLEDPQLLARGLLQPLVHPNGRPVPGAAAAAYPVRFSSLEAGFTAPAPALGQHTHDVLSEVLGLSDDEIARLRERRVV